MTLTRPPHVRKSESAYTDFTMKNILSLTIILLAAAAPVRAGVALEQVRGVSAGNLGAYDGGCRGAGGSCGDEESVERAANGALRTGGLVTRRNASGPSLRAAVPAPLLIEDDSEVKKKPGFFSRKSLMFAGGGAVAGGLAAHFLIGGSLFGGIWGALLGAAIGAVVGFVASKIL